VPEPLNVTIAWHMHQPYYKDPLTERYALPWTYLHGIKDYYDMAAIVEETDGARVVFNLVPSLLEQLRDYADGSAVDPFLVHGGMAPADMTEEHRKFLLDNFFCANRERMIEPHPRYLELLYLAGNGSRNGSNGRLRPFGDQEILDLQVWFFLSWTGEAARRRYPGIRDLIAKGRDFSHDDKDRLFRIHREILREIVPLYRRLQELGKAELSVSPYFHPILPLLCDTSRALDAMPRVTLPYARFRHPEDARAQVARGIAYFTETFGFVPRGMWPSEGAISDEALTVMAECGIRWAASDEGVLAASLADGLGAGKRNLYRPYLFSRGGNNLTLLFRDRLLSDLIGFTYARWEPERAADDFVRRLVALRTEAPDADHATIVLDGENAWEYYPENGYGFLTSLYRKLAATPSLRLVTPSEAAPPPPEAPFLSHVHSGSWINANYGIWIGHPEENAGWDFLARAREAAAARSPEVASLLAAGGDLAAAPGEDESRERRVCRTLYAAEGSDWFWWYGDDHFSPHSAYFDQLFRDHLIHVYRLLELDVPRELFDPIKKVTPAGLVREPTTFITPAVNGKVDDYFEWLGAGLYDLSRQSSAMHAAESMLHCFFYGYDRESFYIRVDGESPLDAILEEDDLLLLHLLLEREYLLPMDRGACEGELLVREHAVWKGAGGLCRWKIGRVAEACIPLEALRPERKSRFFAYITLMRGNDEIGRWPTHAPLALTYAGTELELDNWLV